MTLCEFGATYVRLHESQGWLLSRSDRSFPNLIQESDDEEVASEDEGEVSSEDENDTANNNTVTSEEQPGASTSTEGLDNSQRPKKKRAKGKGEGSSDSQKSEGGTNKNDKEDEYAVDSSDEEVCA